MWLSSPKYTTSSEAKLCYEWWQHEHLARLCTYRDIVRARIVPPLDRLYTDNDWAHGWDDINYFLQLISTLAGDEPVTDTELADLEPLVCEYAARLAEREVQCKNDLCHINRMCTRYLPYLAMSTLRTESPGVSFAVFASLSVIRLCHSTTKIKAAGATVLEQAHWAQYCIKLGFAQVIVAAYDEACQTLDPRLVHSITPPGYSPLPDMTTWRVALTPAHPGPHGMYAIPFGDVSLNLNDLATINDAELDRFMNRWTCTFSRPMRGRPDTLLSGNRDLKILNLMHLEDDECTDNRLDHSHVEHLDDSHSGYAASMQLV
ncbi:hypothetical protein JCM1840_005190 [Sporobolomyces johnsonii]